MRILILTQKIDANDPILGFFCGWAKEFAKRFEMITVICLQKGECNLPANVKVLSLGKEKPSAFSRKLLALRKIKYIFDFYKYIARERN
ncbi:MAG: hypothetical protein KGI39_03395, partial [Patescibacteria group bacterium]|nr:hypothetical protein [Patescibacteria group bacterium]